MTSLFSRARSVDRRQPVTESVVFRSPAGERAEIKGQVLSRLLTRAQNDGNAPEAGGILIGRRILDSADLVVDVATEPFPSDQRTRYRFVRLPEGHQQVLDRLWSDSGGGVTYLGEWHTHPAPTAIPSPEDRRNWGHFAEYSPQGRLIFLILGTGGAIGCWSDSAQWTLED